MRQLLIVLVGLVALCGAAQAQPVVLPQTPLVRDADFAALVLRMANVELQTAAIEQRATATDARVVAVEQALSALTARVAALEQTTPTPVNCAGTWTAWQQMSCTACVSGQQTCSEQRSFVVSIPPANGGTGCPISPEVRTVGQTCNITPPPPAGDHDYFNSLVAHADFWKGISFRPQAGQTVTSVHYEKQLLQRNLGGYAYCNSCPLDIVYDAAMDAAKVTIGTTTNSLRNQIRWPLGTQDGQTYFVTWDVYYTDSYLPSITKLINHKAYQFAASGSTQVFEVRTRFDGGNTVTGGSGPVSGFSASQHVSAIDARSYFTAPGTTKLQPMLPQAGTFILTPNRWVRFFVFIEQHVGTDFFSLWVADQDGIAQIQNRGAVTIPAGGLFDYWVELNTSTDTVAPGRGPMVSFIRNLALLRVSDPTPFLVRPE